MHRSSSRPQLQQLGRAANATERILHLVGDARRDVAVGFLALAFADLFAQRARGASVAEGDDDAARALRVFPENRGGDVHGDRARQVAGELDLVMDGGAAGLAHAGDDAADGMLLPDRGGESAARRHLGGRAQQPRRLVVHECDLVARVEDDHAFEERIEDALEVEVHAGSRGPIRHLRWTQGRRHSGIRVLALVAEDGDVDSRVA